MPPKRGRQSQPCTNERYETGDDTYDRSPVVPKRRTVPPAVPCLKAEDAQNRQAPSHHCYRHEVPDTCLKEIVAHECTHSQREQRDEKRRPQHEVAPSASSGVEGGSG